jgi:colanic acid/amylovoran biosynthesis glycosyltransferase
MSQSKPVIMQLINNLDVGGAQEVVRTLVAYLSAMECTPIVCTLKDGPLRPQIEALGVPVIVLNGRRRNMLNLPGFVADMDRIRRQLAQVVERYEVDIIQTHLLRTLDFLVLSLRWNTPVGRIYWTIHNHNFMLQAHHLKRHGWLLRPKRLAHRLLYRLGAGWVDGFIAVSEDVEQAILRDIGRVGHKVTVINNGVDVRRYGRPVDRAAVRASLGLEAGAKLLIMVGNFKEQKGHRYLLEAAPVLLERHPKLHLLLVGSGGNQAQLQAQVAESGLSGRIHFLGSRSDVPDLLAASDYFILPSLWEGLAMALIEAMASGLPIVATDVSGSGQVMIDGQTGLLISPGNAAEIQRAVDTLLADPAQAQAMGQAARRRVEADFSAQKQAQEHLALFTAPAAGEDAHPAGILAYIIGSYPLLTTTFIDREIESLRASGQPIRILAVRQPHGPISEAQERLGGDVRYMLPLNVLAFLRGFLTVMLRRPLTVARLAWSLLTRPGLRPRARFKTAIHLLQGIYAAHIIRPWRPAHIHAHFADRATTMALVASRLLDVPYSFTAHANDIYVNPVLLPEKMSGAKFVATCTGYNQRYLASLANGDSHKIKRIYHGLDAAAYQANGRLTNNQRRPLVLAVGQLKEKKGFTYLLQACRWLLDQGYDFECHIVGGGPLHAALSQEIDALALGQSVQLLGAQPHRRVVAEFSQASLFVLPAVLGADGDRDGIPNVILEAMAMEVPVVSTDHSGIPEVVHDGQTGLLVPAADVPALARALARLLDDPELGRQMGHNGRQFVQANFDINRNAALLLSEIQS